MKKVAFLILVAMVMIGSAIFIPNSVYANENIISKELSTMNEAYEFDEKTQEILSELDKYLLEDEEGNIIFKVKSNEIPSQEVLDIGKVINEFSGKEDTEIMSTVINSRIAFNGLVYGNYCGKGSNNKKPIDDLDSACKAHDKCYNWGGNNKKCNAAFRRSLAPIIQKNSPTTRKGIVALAAYKMFGG